METLNHVPAIARELGIAPNSVNAAIGLLTEGATIPFIARYRKEATGGLDEVQIRSIDERRAYLLDLDARKEAVLGEIVAQGKLTGDLEAKIRAAATKAEVEDLYLPFKPKRKTRASIARERGLEPLADLITAQPAKGNPSQEASKYVNAEKGIPDIETALAGARDICAEKIAENAQIRALLRETFAKKGVVKVGKTKEYAGQITKFDMYESFEESVSSIPSHRYLAICRGETEEVLKPSLEIDQESLLTKLDSIVGVRSGSPWSGQLAEALRDGLKRLLRPSVQSDVRDDLKNRADSAAVDVFAQNLRELLLSAPFGTKTVLGIDPGQRTGCKCAIVDQTGKLLEHETIYLVQGAEAQERAKKTILGFCRKHSVAAIAVGNGTHGRETETFVRDVIKEAGLAGIIVVSVNEAGASIYSASDVAREEFPDLDLTVRGAISIARRLQDPLAELVKIDPKSIGVGQYQHDVSQPMLAKKLDDVVESCVNSVGVELNTASSHLLARVAGIGPSLARRIVKHRDENGPFKDRKTLLKVSGVGAKTFEQAAGFLRIRGGTHPLDSSAVHPERYALVERIAKDLGVAVGAMVSNDKLVSSIHADRYISAEVGKYTMDDILAELKKPGRDPRKTFEPPAFRDDVRSIEDLKQGMELEGVVTNVTAFGAFVDIGVHQDGLVHVSKLADRFVKDPSEVVKVGDKIRVRVMEVDLARHRIALSAKKEVDSGAPLPHKQILGKAGAPAPDRSASKPQSTFGNNPFAKLGELKKKNR